LADESDFGAVVTDVQLLAQTDLEPSLTLAQVQAIVREMARAQTWTAATPLGYGTYVIPTAANLTGRRYRVISPGTTGAAEPTWSEVDGESFDDNTVTFEEAGPHRGSVYDKRKAAQKCLAVRLAKDQLVDFSGDGRSVRGSQRAERIRALMMSYQPMELA
jgi:hypothetical protein